MKKDLATIVEKFQQNLISRRDFLRETSKMILDTPKFAGFYDMDIIHEFYAFIASRIETIVSRYRKQENASFETWFYLVLKRNFFNFLKKQKIKEKRHDNILKTLQLECYDEVMTDREEISSTILLRLSRNEKKIVSYKYGINISDNDELNNSSDIILNKSERKKMFGEKIARKHLQLIKIQMEIVVEDNPEKKEKLRQREKTIRLHKRNLEIIYYKYKVYPSNRWVAERLGVKEGTVSSYLNKIKNKLNRGKSFRK